MESITSAHHIETLTVERDRYRLKSEEEQKRADQCEMDLNEQRRTEIQLKSELERLASERNAEQSSVDVFYGRHPQRCSQRFSNCKKRRSYPLIAYKRSS